MSNYRYIKTHLPSMINRKSDFTFDHKSSCECQRVIGDTFTEIESSIDIENTDEKTKFNMFKRYNQTIV